MLELFCDMNVVVPICEYLSWRCFWSEKKVREAKIKYFKNCVHSKNIILILNICKIWQSIYLKLIAKNSFTLILQKN